MRRASVRQEQLLKMVTILNYGKFCRSQPSYRHCWANQLRVMDWVHERRIERMAEGRPHWAPSMDDFWQAARDCGDDLVFKNEHGLS